MAETQIQFTGACGLSVSEPLRNFTVGGQAGYSYPPIGFTLMKLAEIPESLRYKDITEASLYFYATSYHGDVAKAEYSIYFAKNPFSVETATYDSVDLDLDDKDRIYSDAVPGYEKYAPDLFVWMNDITGIAIGFPRVDFYTPYGSRAPYISVQHSAEDAGIQPSIISPTEYGGKAIETVFRWALQNTARTFSKLEAVSATLEWRESSGGESHSVDAPPKGPGRIPAGTLLSQTIQWRVSVTSNSGAVRSTEWEEIRMLDPRVDNPTPSSGYVPKLKDSEFSWSLVQPTGEASSVPISQTRAVFKWRASADGPVSEIPVEGSEQKVTVPSGTFSTDKIQWMVTVTSDVGLQASSAWAECSTVETTSTARAISPRNTIIRNDVDNLFAWEHIIETGTLQTGYDLEYSTDNADWKSLKSEKTSTTSVMIPKNTLQGGDLYWRVRTYNTDDTPGEWSEPAYCIVVAAPPAPSVYVTAATPRFSIRWSQVGQEAYEIRLNDTVIAQRYSAEASYQSAEIVEPGTYSVSVRIQSKYGLWSEWGTASLQIKNQSGPGISLTAQPNSDGTVSLFWRSTGKYQSYHVFRDGVRIARVTAPQYEDPFSVGSVSYCVRGILDYAGNYTDSSDVRVAVPIDYPKIASVEDLQWITLKWTTSQIRETSISASKGVTYQHYYGAQLPSAFVGEPVTSAVNFSCAFPRSNLDDAKALEKLLGTTVCVKDPRGARYIGVLESYSKTDSAFWVRYDLTVTLVDWEEDQR